MEQGRLKLDDEIQAHVPQFPNKQWPVTVRQLMGHVAGVGNDSDDDRPLSHQRCERPVEAVPEFADAALLFEPGTGYRYSEYGWVLVSAAVEAAAGQPFLAFMRGQIFRPLGMNNTGAESAKEENPDDVGGPGEDPPPFTLIRELILEPLGVAAPRAKAPGAPATFYAAGWGPHPEFRHGLHVRHPRNLSCFAGAMAFFSTPSDLVRFNLALNGGALLQPATVQQLPPQAAVPSDAFPVAVTMPPESGIVVSVMSNVSHADTSAIARSVAEAFAER
jgi:CubicO group peptidase (beta-lactamase class C family)